MAAAAAAAAVTATENACGDAETGMDMHAVVFAVVVAVAAVFSACMLATTSWSVRPACCCCSSGPS